MASSRHFISPFIPRNQKERRQGEKKTDSRHSSLVNISDYLHRELIDRQQLTPLAPPERSLPRTGRDTSSLRSVTTLLPDDKEIRLVLLGKTGSGKSSLGNLLCAFTREEEQFEADNLSDSVTEKCAIGRTTFQGKTVVVVDTPGFFDTKARTPKERKRLVKEITKSIQASFPGPHAFLIVVKLGKFTKEERESVAQASKIFGQDILKHCIVVFTGKDTLGKRTLDQWLEKANEELKDFLKACGQRYLAVDNLKLNVETERQKMAEEVLGKIMDLRKENNDAVFSSEFLNKANNEIKKNKETIGRMKLQNESTTGATGADATNLTNRSAIEVISDDEVIPQVEAIVEQQIMPIITLS
ncbi:unnamed protein product [Didymodactylos carnosus]|uniref:AIG1-type G domain-containing protein n=1 Tax=Didymodactylos carnosus TaxID=1234261 RepID=A0A815YBY8_9BILA|nr:unnamed protein product [Didymodactylos carnosus]CAF4430823.1 unnamed protein product [Didymodactylos carnosus]